MNVTQFLARLSYGPLSNISMSNDGSGVIAVGKHPALIQHINDGLLRLHTKFILIENELVIEQREDVTSYIIDKAYSVSQAAVPPNDYIRDTVELPYTNDLIKILSVWETGATQLPLNDANHDDSLYTPKFNVLQVPDPVVGAPLYVLYQARHVELASSGAGYLDQLINLPDVLIEGLEAFVAYKVYQGMNGQEHAVKAADYLTTFDRICVEVTAKDLVNSSMSNTNTKFEQRGFK